MNPKKHRDQCVIRELKEELDICIRACNLDKFDKLAEVSFHDYASYCYSKVHVYSIEVSYIDGELKGVISDLKWFNTAGNKLMPYAMMPPTDIYWLPHVFHYHNNPLGRKMYINVDISVDKNQIITSVEFSDRVYKGFYGGYTAWIILKLLKMY